MKLASAFLSFAILIPLAAACGSRGPLDINVIEVNADGSVLGDGPSLSDGSDGSALEDGAVRDASNRDGASDAGRDAHDSGPPNPLTCITCIGQQCGAELAQCFQDPMCRTTIQCVFQMCLGGAGGGFNPQCFLTCSGGNPAEIVNLLKIVQCISAGCGSECSGLLPGADAGG